MPAARPLTAQPIDSSSCLAPFHAGHAQPAVHYGEGQPPFHQIYRVAAEHVAPPAVNHGKTLPLTGDNPFQNSTHSVPPYVALALDRHIQRLNSCLICDTLIQLSA